MRKLNAYAGIVVTASHNPPEYNGYKVYGDDGAQLPPKEADIVIAEVNAIENELTIQVEDEQSLKEKGLIKIIGEEIDKPYTEKLTSISVHPELSDEVDVSVVFTPLHGTANKPVRRGLEALGYKNVTVVKEQELPDPDFQPSNRRIRKSTRHSNMPLSSEKNKMPIFSSLRTRMPTVSALP